MPRSSTIVVVVAVVTAVSATAIAASAVAAATIATATAMVSIAISASISGVVVASVGIILIRILCAALLSLVGTTRTLGFRAPIVEDRGILANFEQLALVSPLLEFSTQPTHENIFLNLHSLNVHRHILVFDKCSI